MIDVSKTDVTKIYDLAARLVDYYRFELESQKIDASGRLSKTADFEVELDEFHLSIYFILESYYYYIEQGRGPSTGKFGSWTTKLHDIEQWLKFKIARGSFVPSSGHTIPHTDKEIKSVSYVIARKITKFGFYGLHSEGKHPLKEAMDKAEAAGLLDAVIDEVMKTFAGAVDAEIEKIW